MAIPLSYNIRNLVVRRTTTIMTALGVGQVVPHMTSAVLSADSFTVGDAGETGAGKTVAITTMAATPIDTVIRVATAKAPSRPTHLP